MRTLELCSGTQSFSKGIIRYDQTAEIITVDILKKFNPTHLADILTWDYKQYQPQYFDIIWASPPCTEYSKAKTQGVRDLEFADKLVLKCFEIIDYLQPKYWLLENVGTGLLVSRMNNIRPNLKHFFVDYCVYGKPYRKRTVIWTNVSLKLELCKGAGLCQSMVDNHHMANIGNQHPRYSLVGFTLWQKNSIPESLIDTIIQQIQH